MAMNISRIFIQNNFKFSRHYAKSVHPFTKTWGLLNKEIKSGFDQQKVDYPQHADVVIIGGGFIGSSAAYWLKTRAGEGLSVVVIEKDSTYKMCQNIHSHGFTTQHFTLPENIYLSQYSAEFLRNIKTHLNEDVDIEYNPHGNLILACEKYAHKLEENVTMQREYGVKNKILTVDEIQKMYPWLKTSDVKLGCMSTEGEGTFNCNNLLKGLVAKSKDLGATYVNAEAVSFEMEAQRDVLMEGVKPGSFQKINRLLYRNEHGEDISIKFAVCVVAAGTESTHIAELAGIGIGSDLLTVPLPVEKRTYDVYSIENEANKMSFGLNTPYIMDTSGLWSRRNGLQSNLISGLIPPLNPTDTPDSDIFHSAVNNRYPGCKDSKIQTISTEYTDCNTYDDTGILGPHPYHTNLIFATGFSRQGVHHSPGIGKGIAEIIIDCQYSTIDLSRFGFDRILIDEPLIEFNMY